jgi:plasmid stabilization system protein ParE
LEKVEEIARFIAMDKPGAATQWTKTLFESIHRTGCFPKRGRVVPESARPEIREVFHGDYRVIYRLHHKHIEVLTVRHGRRLFSPSEII